MGGGTPKDLDAGTKQVVAAVVAKFTGAAAMESFGCEPADFDEEEMVNNPVNNSKVEVSQKTKQDQEAEYTRVGHKHEEHIVCFNADSPPPPY